MAVADRVLPGQAPRGGLMFELGAIEKAKERAAEADLNLTACREAMRNATPGDLNDATEVAQRRAFLTRSLGDPQLAARSLERVLVGNELQPVNYLARGAIAARAIARIEVNTPAGARYAWGSGFLIAPRVLLTNNHVLPGDDWARSSAAHFLYEADLSDNVANWVEFGLDPDSLYYTSKELDFTIVAVRPAPSRGNRVLDDFGWLPLLDVAGKASEGEWLTIIQHPNGEPKQVCVRENRLMKRGDDVLWYSTDTLGGSSGSPVFNNDWYVVALHHSGVPEERDGKIRGVDGQFYDPAVLSDDRVKWIANEGIRASRIAQTLKQQFPDHPLLRPMYQATPHSARVGIGRTFAIEIDSTNVVSNPSIPPSTLTGNTTMQTETTRTVPLNVTLQYNPATGQIESAAANVTGNGHAAMAAMQSESMMATSSRPMPVWNPASAENVAETLEEAKRTRAPRREASFDAPFDEAYDKRKGYEEDYLGKADFNVRMPTLTAALKQHAVRLIDDKNDYVLKYHNYSVVMHKTRRFAMFSAANVNFSQRYEMSRTPDVWRTDPRIPLETQISNFYYASNKFDRGHLTRREDLEFGATPVAALQSAADTCHWTNCTPQHEKFNQNKEIWQGIERHVLENAIVKGKFKAQVITGPVLDEGDPEFKEIQYPVSYWKVVAAINADDKLVATAYIASQAEVIAHFGIEAAPVDPFGPFKTFQVPIKEIERVTGLTFTSGTALNPKPLRDVDPLNDVTAAAARRRRNRRAGPFESATVAAAGSITPAGYVELASVDDIIM